MSERGSVIDAQLTFIEQASRKFGRPVFLSEGEKDMFHLLWNDSKAIGTQFYYPRKRPVFIPAYHSFPDFDEYGNFKPITPTK